MSGDTHGQAGKSAVVLLSGGLDSATALAIARDAGYTTHALSIAYGQRHNAELAAADRVARALGAAQHKVVDINLDSIGGSALTDSSIDVPETPSEGIPITYVPARNTIMLSIALGWAEVLNAEAIFIGVNAVDYSGYPDCRPQYIEAFRAMAAIATKSGVQGNPVRIETPLIDLTKAQIIKRGAQLSVDYALTVSCYQAGINGAACGVCDSCRIRTEGFAQAKQADPTIYAKT